MIKANYTNNVENNKNKNILKNNAIATQDISNIIKYPKRHSINVLQKLLIRDKDNIKENNNILISDNNLIKNPINSNKKKTIFDLYEQNNKLNKKLRLHTNKLNLSKKRTYEQLIFYNLNLFDKKKGKNKSSFITDTNNNNFSTISDKKYILNYYRGQSLDSLVNNIKMKNGNKRLYKFLRDELFQNNNLEKMENENKYLNNLDKYFIKKYSEFQVLISYADDHL